MYGELFFDYRLRFVFNGKMEYLIMYFYRLRIMRLFFLFWGDGGIVLFEFFFYVFFGGLEKVVINSIFLIFFFF